MPFEPSGRKESERLSLQRAVKLLRAASKAGAKPATKADVEHAARSIQSGGRTVMSMDYYHARGGSAVPFPQAFFGRPSVVCGPSGQCGGGAAAAASLDAIKEAAAQEGIKATPFALKAAHSAGVAYAVNLGKLLKHDAPNKRWTKEQVRKSAC